MITVSHEELVRRAQLKHKFRILVSGIIGNDPDVLGIVFSVALRPAVTIDHVESDRCCVFKETALVYYNDDRGERSVEFPGVAALLTDLYGYVSMWAGLGVIPATGRIDFFDQGVNEDLEEWVFRTCPHFAR